MSNEFYKQCSLERSGSFHVAWIPEKYAIQGSYVRIKEDGDWVDGFLVKEAFQTRMSHTALQDKAAMDRKFWEKDWHHRVNALKI